MNSSGIRPDEHLAAFHLAPPAGTASTLPLREYTRRYKGKEVRLVETYLDRDDAFCCPSFKRVTYFRFSPRPDRFVRYGTRVSRIR
jgi:hypothetical protein